MQPSLQCFQGDSMPLTPEWIETLKQDRPEKTMCTARPFILSFNGNLVLIFGFYDVFDDNHHFDTGLNLQWGKNIKPFSEISPK